MLQNICPLNGSVPVTSLPPVTVGLQTMLQNICPLKGSVHVTFVTSIAFVGDAVLFANRLLYLSVPLPF